MITEETLILDLKIPTVTKNILFSCKIYKISDLINYKIIDLMRFRGLSKNRISQLNSLLNDNGYFLK